MGSNDPDQHLVILGTTAIGFKPPYQCQGFFRTEIDLVEVFEEFEASKHDRLHCKGEQVQDVRIRCLM